MDNIKPDLAFPQLESTHTTVKPPVKRREFATWTIFLLNVNIAARDQNGMRNNTTFNNMCVFIPRGDSLDFFFVRGMAEF